MARAEFFPGGVAQTGVLSCFTSEMVLYRMQTDTAARRRQNGNEPDSSRDLDVLSAAIFAYSGTPPTASMVQILLARQPQRRADVVVTLPLSGGNMLWLQYDSFTISSLR